MEESKEIATNNSDPTQNLFVTAMIVFEKSKNRKENFEFIKASIIPDLIFFPAADSINDYERVKNRSNEMNYNSQFYLNKSPSGGKLGCNVSHPDLLNYFKTLSNEWFLVLEDDITIKDYDANIINSVIETANKNNSHYVQLYTNPAFNVKQRYAKKIAPNIYSMIPQWHTLAYLINKKGIDILFSKFPMNTHIDHVYSENIKELNAICYINTMFENGGAKSRRDNSSKYGSLIYKLPGELGKWNE